LDRLCSKKSTTSSTHPSSPDEEPPKDLVPIVQILRLSQILNDPLLDLIPSEKRLGGRELRWFLNCERVGFVEEFLSSYLVGEVVVEGVEKWWFFLEGREGGGRRSWGREDDGEGGGGEEEEGEDGA